MDRIDELGVPPSEQATRYVFQQAQMGWINIDAFYKLGEEKVDLIVKNDDQMIEGRVFIHFPKIKSCINMRIEDGLAKQEGFPLEEEAKTCGLPNKRWGIQCVTKI